MQNKINVFRIEEHHEAFLVWDYALRENMILNKDNTLLHVDEHSDMASPTMNTSIHTSMNSLEDTKNFIYSQLGIASFIIPACYLDIFTNVFWIRQEHKEKENKLEKMWVRSYDKKGMKLLTGKYEDSQSLPDDPDRKTYYFKKCTVEQAPANYSNIILDIDLDYFSCTGSPYLNKPISIEITKEEYQHYHENKYYPLKLIYNSILEPIKYENKYYLIFNKVERIYPNKQLVSNEIIQKRVDLLIDQLKEKKIEPQLITICRSRYSGYTHEDQWEFIENNLLKGLNEIFEIEINDEIRFTSSFFKKNEI